jgi:hypothetical protein
MPRRAGHHGLTPRHLDAGRSARRRLIDPHVARVQARAAAAQCPFPALARRDSLSVLWPAIVSFPSHFPLRPLRWLARSQLVRRSGHLVAWGGCPRPAPPRPAPPRAASPLLQVSPRRVGASFCFRRRASAGREGDRYGALFVGRAQCGSVGTSGCLFVCLFVCVCACVYFRARAFACLFAFALVSSLAVRSRAQTRAPSRPIKHCIPGPIRTKPRRRNPTMPPVAPRPCAAAHRLRLPRLAAHAVVVGRRVTGVLGVLTLGHFRPPLLAAHGQRPVASAVGRVR